MPLTPRRRHCARSCSCFLARSALFITTTRGVGAVFTSAPARHCASTRSPAPTSVSVISVAFARVVSPGGSRLYWVLSLRLTVEITPLSARRTICLAVASIAFTSPTRLTIAGAVCAGDPLGVCPWTRNPNPSATTVTSVIIVSLCTIVLSVPCKISIVYASPLLFVAKSSVPSSKNLRLFGSAYKSLMPRFLLFITLSILLGNHAVEFLLLLGRQQRANACSGFLSRLFEPRS